MLSLVFNLPSLIINVKLKMHRAARSFNVRTDVMFRCKGYFKDKFLIINGFLAWQQVHLKKIVEGRGLKEKKRHTRESTLYLFIFLSYLLIIISFTYYHVPWTDRREYCKVY